MLEMRNKITCLFILLSFTIVKMPANDGLRRGLYFQSFEVNKDKRTCLDLTPDRPLTFGKGFSMEFDVRLRWEHQSFGYIFRMIANDTLNIDLLSDLTSEETNFSVVTKNRVLLQYLNTEIGDEVENVWIKARLVLDPANNKIAISLNGVGKEAVYPLNGLKKFRIYFGGNDHVVFSTTDIAPMLVKDIRIFNEESELVRYWTLGKHLHNGALDECASRMATVQNPVWETDHHAKWRKQTVFVCPGRHYQIAFDPKGNRVFMVRDRRLFIYHIEQQRLDSVRVRGGIPYNLKTNQMLYDPNRDMLISYDIENANMVLFDFNTGKWNNETDTLISPKFMHHGKAYIARDSMIVTFGGYGYHKYNGLLNTCAVRDAEWKRYNIAASVAPRYLCAVGQAGERELLVFGGFGNESGRQEEFPRNYYDLHSINLDNREVRKIWELSGIREHFTNSNSLIFDKKSGKFYALAYPNKRYASAIMLHEYHAGKPEYRVMGDTIPYFFNDVESYCDLFQDANRSELYAVTSSVKGNDSEIGIYSITYPPVGQEDVFQQRSLQQKWWWALLLLIPVAALCAALVNRKRKNEPDEKQEENTQETDPNDKTIVYEPIVRKKQPLSIHLLGHFQIINREGFDIAVNLTPTTTQLFLLLIIATIKNGRGVTSQELKNTLWNDKDDYSARNNRNVYISKLRSILKAFEEITIVNDDGYWAIRFGTDIFCDYERALLLLKMLQQQEHVNRPVLNELVDLALTGKLLPYALPSEWLEAYQTDFTNVLIESLIKVARQDGMKTDLVLLVKIADIILLHENIDEDAIKFKCYALFHLGRKNQALQAFNKFSADYTSLLGVRHNLSFEDLIKQE
jgi:two-component SAPR family response regulator